MSVCKPSEVLIGLLGEKSTVRTATGPENLEVLLGKTFEDQRVCEQLHVES